MVLKGVKIFKPLNFRGGGGGGGGGVNVHGWSAAVASLNFAKETNIIRVGCIKT